MKRFFSAVGLLLMLILFQNCGGFQSQNEQAFTEDIPHKRLVPGIGEMDSSKNKCAIRSYGKSAKVFAKGSTGELFRGRDLDFFIEKTLAITKNIPVNHYVRSNREDAIMGNNQGEMLSSYLFLYRASQDLYYLNRFIIEARGTLSLRDDKTGVQSSVGVDANGAAILGVVPAWSTRNYSLREPLSSISHGAYYAYLVETGQLTYPMADFAQFIINGPDCLKEVVLEGKTMLQHAVEIQGEVVKTVSYYHQSFQFAGTSLDRGFWVARFPAQGNVVGKAFPLNYNLAMANTIGMLYLGTKDPDYARVVGALANFFYDELEWYPSEVDSARPGYYLWHYWPKIPSATVYSFMPHDNLEDIGHLTVDYEFVTIANRIGVGMFTSRYPEVLGRLGFTYLEKYATDTFNRNCAPGVPICENGHRISYARSDSELMPFAEYHPMLNMLVRQYSYDGLIRMLNLHLESNSARGRKSMAQFIWYWAQRFESDN